MVGMLREPERFHGVVRDLFPAKVAVPIQLRFYSETTLRRRVPNEANDGFVACQWNPFPIHRNKREHLVFYLIPFACSRWKVADGYIDARPIHELLQIKLPGPASA